MNLEILTPDKTVYEGPATAVTVPGTLGTFQILNDHAPIVSTLEAGEVVVRGTSSKGDNPEIFMIKGGVVEVLHNKVMILVQG